MGWSRKQRNRTENGPRWENKNPGAGCNATHVARTRRWWKRFANRTARRTGQQSSKFHSMSSQSRRPSPLQEESDE